MKTYHILYTIDGIDYEINVNANNDETALDVVREIIPSASKITLVL